MSGSGSGSGSGGGSGSGSGSGEATVRTTTANDRRAAERRLISTTAVPSSVTGRIAELRGDFDQSFAAPARSHEGEQVELLAVSAGGRPYAIRLSQTSGLHPDRPVTPLPGPLPALLGLAGFAGSAIPVYDLAALLGHPVTERPRWLVLAAGSPPLGLAFHQVDGHVRVAASTVVGEAGGAGARGCLRGMVALTGGERPIIDVPAARDAVYHLTGHVQHTDEEAAR